MDRAARDLVKRLIGVLAFVAAGLGALLVLVVVVEALDRRSLTRALAVLVDWAATSVCPPAAVRRSPIATAASGGLG